MTFTTHLKSLATPHWQSQLSHPFVQGIATGSLPTEKFKHWILQDYRYLIEYSRVFAYATAKADRLDSMSWYADVLNLTLNTEMDLHRQYAARFQISSEDLEREAMWPTTRAYTDFLVRTAADGDMLDLLAALLPCTWGYVYLAKEMAKGQPPRDQRYSDWIEQYASEEFAQALDWLRKETDRLAETMSEDKQAKVLEIFLTSVRYEWLFWEMCWKGESWEG